jgi:hypothetical protein
LSAEDRTASVPLTEPPETGAKVTVKVALWFGGSVIGRLSPLTEKPELLTFAAEMVSADPPVLVNVSDRLELLLFCTLPKESVDEDADRAEPALETGRETPWQPVNSAIPVVIHSEPIKRRCDKTRKGLFFQLGVLDLVERV